MNAWLIDFQWKSYHVAISIGFGFKLPLLTVTLLTGWQQMWLINDNYQCRITTTIYPWNNATRSDDNNVTCIIRSVPIPNRKRRTLWHVFDSLGHRTSGDTCNFESSSVFLDCFTAFALPVTFNVNHKALIKPVNSCMLTYLKQNISFLKGTCERRISAVRTSITSITCGWKIIDNPQVFTK